VASRAVAAESSVREASVPVISVQETDSKPAHIMHDAFAAVNAATIASKMTVRPKNGGLKNLL